LRARLLASALARPGVEVVAPARVVRIERDATSLVATLDDGRRLGTELLIGADGRGSQVRQLAGFGVDRWSYPQSALTFALRHERSHGGRVREYLRRPGPLALLPLARDLCSVTWIERQAVAERLLGLEPDRLLAELCQRIGDQLAPAGICGRPVGHALGAHCARRFVGPRVALVGDAAHGVHPIHAQGFNLGVRDVAALAEVLVEARRQKLDLGSGEVLIRYDRWRRNDTRLVLGLTDGLNRLFSSDLAPARLIRGMGLSALGWLAPLRHLAMRRGMGLAGDLPKLARGDAL
jgi:2-octaprenyl-6-methoxyphenol hydroxylase